jgi:hypothetical protein
MSVLLAVNASEHRLAWMVFWSACPVERHHEGVKHTVGLQPDSPIEVVEEIPFIGRTVPNMCITSLARTGNATGIYIFWGRKSEREPISA